MSNATTETSTFPGGGASWEAGSSNVAQIPNGIDIPPIVPVSAPSQLQSPACSVVQLVEAQLPAEMRVWVQMKAQEAIEATLELYGIPGLLDQIREAAEDREQSTPWRDALDS